ncbi:MAG: triose-phosphate isomerase [Spirochaetota bacterium]
MVVKREEEIVFAGIKKKFPLQNVSEPQLFRDLFPYSSVCRVPFENTYVPVQPAERFRISDTTFRDGQQARPPYSVEQIGEIFDYLHRLSGSHGLISHSEFFLYTKRDRDAVELCRSKGYPFPRITSWIRANKSDFELVKDMELDETGILTSVSDYHIFLKMGWTREDAMKNYLDIARTALEAGIIPRLHLEDITRADIYGFVVPFVQEIVKIMEDAKLPVKLRLCDTMGYGVTYPTAALPRSVPKLIRAIIDDGGFPGKYLEWHGHNDFHRSFENAANAWMYGCETVNSTLLGFGERTGNTPLEAMVIEYLALTGDDAGIDTTAITDMARYFETIDFRIPANYPFVGADFNVTRAGIHADGLIKNEEIYNIFDTDKLLKRPLGVAITDKSGTAGVAKWINSHLALSGKAAVDKKHPGILRINTEILSMYEEGRVSSISNDELVMLAQKHLPEYFISDFEKIKMREEKFALEFIARYLEHPEIRAMNIEAMEELFHGLMDKDPFVRFAYVVDPKGIKLTRHITQITDRSVYDRKLIDTDYSDRDWFINVMKNGKSYVSDLFISKITGVLTITVSGPITTDDGEIIGVLGMDINFEDFSKIDQIDQLTV